MSITMHVSSNCMFHECRFFFFFHVLIMQFSRTHTFIQMITKGQQCSLNPSMMEHRVLSLDNSTFCKSFKFIVCTKVLLTFMNETHNKQKVFARNVFRLEFCQDSGKIDISLEVGW